MFSEKMATGLGYRLLELAGGELPHYKFMKLMYLSEREWLRFAGVTMTGDRLKNMDKGPMLSGAYSCMRAGLPKRGDWSSSLSQIDERTVRILRPLEGRSPLSRKQQEIVESVWAAFGHMTEEEIIDFTHGLPEYHEPAGSSVDIDLGEVFVALGRDSSEAAELVDRLKDRENVRKFTGAVA